MHGLSGTGCLATSLMNLLVFVFIFSVSIKIPFYSIMVGCCPVGNVSLKFLSELALYKCVIMITLQLLEASVDCCLLDQSDFLNLLVYDKSITLASTLCSHSVQNSY